MAFQTHLTENRSGSFSSGHTKYLKHVTLSYIFHFIACQIIARQMQKDRNKNETETERIKGMEEIAAVICLNG